MRIYYFGKLISDTANQNKKDNTKSIQDVIAEEPDDSFEYVQSSEDPRNFAAKNAFVIRDFANA